MTIRCSRPRLTLCTGFTETILGFRYSLEVIMYTFGLYEVYRRDRAKYLIFHLND